MANTPKVYVICDQNCKYEGLTREQILTAITQAVNEGTVSDIDVGFVQTIKTINNVPLKFFVGTQAEYAELTDEDKVDLFALITNDTTREGIEAAIEELRGTVNSQQAEIEGLQRDLASGSFTVNSALYASEALQADKATTATKLDSGFYRESIIQSNYTDYHMSKDTTEMIPLKASVKDRFIIVKFRAIGGNDSVGIMTPPIRLNSIDSLVSYKFNFSVYKSETTVDGILDIRSNRVNYFYLFIRPNIDGLVLEDIIVET